VATLGFSRVASWDHEPIAQRGGHTAGRKSANAAERTIVMAIEPWRAVVETEALEQWLRAALAVDPSPEFVAKTRVRIATETQPRPWLVGLLLIIAIPVIYVCWLLWQ
jgi:hypothetical protein